MRVDEEVVSVLKVGFVPFIFGFVEMSLCLETERKCELCSLGSVTQLAWLWVWCGRQCECECASCLVTTGRAGLQIMGEWVSRLTHNALQKQLLHVSLMEPRATAIYVHLFCVCPSLECCVIRSLSSLCILLLWRCHSSDVALCYICKSLFF